MIGTNLKNHWLSQGLEINSGVSREELAAFESRYQVSLPSDLRDYFLTVNGMAEGVSDDALIRFWSLNEVKPIPEEAPGFSGERPIRMFESFSELVSNYLTDADLLLDMKLNETAT